MGETLPKHIAHGTAHLVCMWIPWLPHALLSHGPCCISPSAQTICRPCVCVASSHHSHAFLQFALCLAWPASAFLALWLSCSACGRACCSAIGSPYLALSFGRCTEVVHALHCGLALSPVRHDVSRKSNWINCSSGTLQCASPAGCFRRCYIRLLIGGKHIRDKRCSSS